MTSFLSGDAHRCIERGSALCLHHRLWQNLDPHEAAKVAAFWKREGALTEESQIAERLSQLVMHVRDGEAVAAVCTAVPITPPHFG